jgi:dipeptidase D
MKSKIKTILENFEQISRIPRRSKHEEKISRWLQDWASDRGLGVRKDAAGNLCIRVEPTTGCEKAPTVIVQGHMDMVCEKTEDSADHDFNRDPIRFVYDGDWLKADGTSLGADNGIALALAMTLVDDDTVSHPPLELLFTVDEESGLTGATKLDADIFNGRLLLNLDSEEEGVFTVGCAGGKDVSFRLAVETAPCPEDQRLCELIVRGLCGGHSGVDIHKRRASANRLIARTLWSALGASQVQLVSVKGGTVHNAIARDAAARIVCHPSDVSKLGDQIRQLEQMLQEEYASVEPSLQLVFQPVEQPSAAIEVLSPEDTRRVVHLLLALPHGVAGMCADVPSIVETSNNLATVELADKNLKILSSQRSSVMSRLEELTSRVESIAALAGARTSVTNSYPAWQPDMASPLLSRCRQVYQGLFGEKPKVQIIHAGLECGIIGAKKKGMQMISFGPNIENPHSPDERLHIPSVDKVWEFLVGLMKAF